MLILYLSAMFFDFEYNIILILNGIQDHQHSFGSGYNQTILTGPLH